MRLSGYERPSCSVPMGVPQIHANTERTSACTPRVCLHLLEISFFVAAYADLPPQLLRRERHLPPFVANLGKDECVPAAPVFEPVVGYSVLADDTQELARQAPHGCCEGGELRPGVFESGLLAANGSQRVFQAADMSVIRGDVGVYQ